MRPSRLHANPTWHFITNSHNSTDRRQSPVINHLCSPSWPPWLPVRGLSHPTAPQTVENFGLFNSALDNGADASLRTAQGILAALRRRELYAYANQFTVPPEYIMDGRWDVSGGYAGGDRVGAEGAAGDWAWPGEGGNGEQNCGAGR